MADLKNTAFDKRTRMREIQLKKKIASVFTKLEADVLDNILQSGSLTINQVELILSSMVNGDTADAYDKIVTDARMEAMARGRRKETSQMQRMGVSVNFTEFSPTVVKIIEGANAQANAKTLARLQGDLSTVLQTGYKDGLGTKEIAKLVQSEFKTLKQFEAERIARTEINSAQNQGIFSTREEMKVTKHQWVTALDDRVRDTHINLHLEIVTVGQPFSNGLLFPGDKSGDIKEWINCRCTTIPVL